MNEWVNKPVPFKRSDPVDAARYDFARTIPFTKMVKQMLDNLMNQQIPIYQLFANIPIVENYEQIESIPDEIIEDSDQFL